MSIVEHRYFFALLPPLMLARDIFRLSLTQGLGRRVLLDHLHMTLAVTADFAFPRPDLAAKMVRMADELASGAFALALDWIRASPRSIALRPSERPDRMRLLQQQLWHGMANAGLCRPDWHFNPHVTLLYRDGRPFHSPIPPYRWHAEELVLVHSHVGLTRHDIIGRWPLRP